MMRSTSLKDKIVVVTGGAQGIGGGVARAAAESGAAGICISGRNAEKGEKAAAELSKICPTIFVAGELKDEKFCRALMAKTEERFKRIDGLVNAAGMTDRGHIDTTSVELWDAIFAVNVRAPFILTQELVRRLKRDKKPGAIVNIITMSSHGGQPFLTAYSTSKGALAKIGRAHV